MNLSEQQKYEVEVLRLAQLQQGDMLELAPV